MTSSTEEDKERMKQYFTEKQKSIAEKIVLFKDRYRNAKSDTLTPFKTYTAFGWLAYEELGELFKLLHNVYENLVELDKDITEKTERLDKLIQEVSSRTGTELESLKATLKEPMWTRIDQFLQAMEVKEKEEKKKAGEASRQMIS